MNAELRARICRWRLPLKLMQIECFDKNEETAALLKALEICTEDLDKMIKQQTDVNR